MLNYDWLDRNISLHSNIKRKGFDRHLIGLFSIAIGMEAKNIIEFGAGESTRVLLDALEINNGKYLYTNDIRSLSDIEASVGNLISPNLRYYQKDHKEFIEDINDIGILFDLCLHDGSHEKDDLFYDLTHIISFMKKNSLVLVHDTLHPQFGLEKVVVEAFQNTKHQLLTLPYGFGLTIVKLLEGNVEHTTEWKK